MCERVHHREVLHEVSLLDNIFGWTFALWVGLCATADFFSTTTVDIWMKLFKMGFDGISDELAPAAQWTEMVVTVPISPVVVGIMSGNAIGSDNSFGHLRGKESFLVTGRTEEYITVSKICRNAYRATHTETVGEYCPRDKQGRCINISKSIFERLKYHIRFFLHDFIRSINNITSDIFSSHN